MPMDKRSLNPLLTWLWDLLSFYSTEEIRVPTEYHDQVLEIKDVLDSDVSGIVNSMLDYAINSAMVDFNVDSENPNFQALIEEWFSRVNEGLVGRVPVGMKNLSREYYRERWKNSSLIVMRTLWEKVNMGGQVLELPVKMWFVDGVNVDVEDESLVRSIGDEKYFLRIHNKEHKAIPASENELIFVQKPFTSWTNLYPTPFMISRGLWKNLKFFELMNKKGEKIVGKALEYLMLMKKGSEQLAMKGAADFIYSEEDLTKVKNDFNDLVVEGKSTAGTPTYVTNFDTSLEHIIPEYSKVMNEGLYTVIEKRLLAGLGLIEIVEGIASTRREAILNPKPFVKEVETGISDFVALVSDVMRVIVMKNKSAHPKFFSEANKIQLHYNPIKDFISDSIREHLRSMYDRGVLSKQTYSEVVGGVDIDIEVSRRTKETKDKLDDTMYPPVIQNMEAVLDANKPQPKNEDIPSDKQGIEKKNYKGETEDIPYKNNDELPDSVKAIPVDAQTLYRRVFNQSSSKGEAYAGKVAWSVVKKFFKKDKEGNWTKKRETSETASFEELIDELLKFQEIELREKQLEIADKLLKDN